MLIKLITLFLILIAAISVHLNYFVPAKNIHNTELQLNSEISSSTEANDLNSNSIEIDTVKIEEKQTEEDISNTKNIILHGKEIKTYGPLSYDFTALDKLLNSYKYNISFSVYSLVENKGFSYNTTQNYFSACTIKAPFMYSVCKEIEEENIDINEKITYQKKHYHKGSGQIRKSSFGTQYTIKELIKLSLSISDNVAYEMLIDRFGKQYHNQNMDNIGCPSLKLNNSSIWCNSANPVEFSIVWQEIYKYFISGSEMAHILKNSCTNTPFNYATVNLNKNVYYSHKSGDNYPPFQVYNDTAIVWTEKPFIISIFTTSNGDTETKQIINHILDIGLNNLK